VLAGAGTGGKSPTPPLMRTPSTSSTILVTAAAEMASLGPRRFRQLAGLETEAGKASLELAYVGGRAVISREKAMAVVARIRAERGRDAPPRHVHLGRFTERCAVDPDTGERLCIEEACGARVSGRGKLCAARGKLCAAHSAARSAARLSRRSRRQIRATPR
jgi:hypothetical protein